jgi:hypothetical protein
MIKDAITGAAELEIEGDGVYSSITGRPLGVVKDGKLYSAITGREMKTIEGTGGGGSIELPEVNVTADKMLNGVTAINTAGNVVTGTISSQGAKTYTPTTSDQSIAAGKYLSGKQTIKGDADLKAENIKAGVSIFNVTGSYEGGAFAKVTGFNVNTNSISAVSATYSNGTWNKGNAVTITSYDVEPVKDGIYLVNGNKLVGNAVAYDFEKWMPTSGLLSYLPMTGVNTKAIDYVSGMILSPHGEGVRSEADAWYGNNEEGSVCGGLPYPCPQIFTLCAKFRMDDYPSYGDILPIFQVDGGFALYVGSDDRVRTYMRHSQGEVFDFNRGEEYTLFFSCSGSNIKVYCTDSNGEVWHQNQRGMYDEPDVNAISVYILGYAGAATFTGKVWDVLLYNRILTDNEISAIANH